MPAPKRDFFAEVLNPIATHLHPVVILAGITAMVYVFSTVEYYGGAIFIFVILAHTVYVNYKYHTFKPTVFTGPMTTLLWCTANLLWQTRTNWPEEARIWVWACIWLAFAVCLEAYGTKVRTWSTMRVTTKNISEAAEDMLYTLGDLFVDYFRDVTVIVAVVYSAVLFTVEAGLPWGMPWVFFVPPISYISYRLINKKFPPRFSYVVFVLCNVVCIAYYPANRVKIVPIPTCTGPNIGQCGEDFHLGPPIPNQPGCCCLQSTYPWPTFQMCTPCASEAREHTDCLGRPVTDSQVKDLSVTGLLCNNNNPNAEMRDIFEDKFGCICAKGYCGQSCEVNNPDLCERVTLSREEAVCSNIPPGSDSPLVCNQMGAGT